MWPNASFLVIHLTPFDCTGVTCETQSYQPSILFFFSFFFCCCGHLNDMKSVGIREARGQSVNMTFLLRCCNTIREEINRMLGRDKNRVLWQSTDFFSGERNRKLASTAACITELEMCVGSHTTSFSLYFILSLYLSFSLVLYTLWLTAVLSPLFLS